jgi:predicted  nucleic acid-binding Zn-ribbon protein
VADKERLNRTLEHVNKDQTLKIEELDKQLRAANTRIQEQEDEIACLEAQREDLKKGNAAARESLRKASSDIKAMQGACVGAVVQDVLGGLRFRV